MENVYRTFRQMALERPREPFQERNPMTLQRLDEDLQVAGLEARLATNKVAESARPVDHEEAVFRMKEGGARNSFKHDVWKRVSEWWDR